MIISSYNCNFIKINKLIKDCNVTFKIRFLKRFHFIYLLQNKKIYFMFKAKVFNEKMKNKLKIAMLLQSTIRFQR